MSIKRNEVQYFKVLRQDLTSVGLLGATKMQYHFGIWNRPLEPLSAHPRKGGGLWVFMKKYHAKRAKKYLLEKHNIVARIFACRIGRIIYQTSYRTKTDGVFLTQKDELKEL